jgi:hypothetical protein
MSRKKLKGKNYTVGFSNKQASPWGGLALVKQMLDFSRFREAVKSWGLPQPGSNRGYPPIDIIEQFMMSISRGANRFAHTDLFRFETTLMELFGWSKMAERKAIMRFFARFNQGLVEAVQAQMFGWVNSKITGISSVTLDVDSTVLTRSGTQEGANKGYNPQKPGRSSHHPLVAFVADTRMVANFWLRPGNTHTTNNLIPFLQSTIHNLGEKTVGLLRADSGFYSNEILSFLEKGQIKYVVAARLYAPLQHALYVAKNWRSVAPGIDICELYYRADNWSEPRRFIGVRQYKKVRKNAPGKNLKLFEDDPLVTDWRYSLMVTSMNCTPEQVWRRYRQRADSENRIRELKSDFGLGSFNMRQFWATEAALCVAMLTYNIFSLFRQAILKTKTQHTLSTLHGMIFAVAAFWDPKTSSKEHLLLCIPRQKRAWFCSLWELASEPEGVTLNF